MTVRLVLWLLPTFLFAYSRTSLQSLLPDLSLQPPRVITEFGLDHVKSSRGAQGVPSLERTIKGRFWAAWYTGKSKRGIESPFSYVVLATSGDDGKTWLEKLVIQPRRFVHSYDPCLWIDPRGRLWFFWAQSAGLQDGRMGVWAIMTEAPDSENPKWSQPRRIANGIMLNKPTVLNNGDWLLPVGLWRDNPRVPNINLDGYDLSPYTKAMLEHNLGEERGSNVYRSRDEGKTFERIGQARIPNTQHDEHMIIERRDGSLWMLVRNPAGIAHAVSTDGGKTWSPAGMYMEARTVAGKRFFIRRLNSGALLMVRNNAPDGGRSHMTAFVSDDDGATWKGGFLLDERESSYPDGVQAADGTIYIIYDHQRYTLDRLGREGAGSVLMAALREEDVRAGRSVTDMVRLRMVVSRLREAAGGLPDLALQAPYVIASPWVEHYAQTNRQGVSGIERTAQGRLWAVWVKNAESPRSYVVTATSSDDGRTWSDLKLVIQPRRFVRAGSPCVWLDPQGRMWLFWAQSAGQNDGRWGVWTIVTSNPDAETPTWSEPWRIANGVMLNKPTVLVSGDWLLPIGTWRENTPNLGLEDYDIRPYTRQMLLRDLGQEHGSNVFRSRDRGSTFEFLGQARVPGTRVDEHMLIERRDGSLWMLVRTTRGIGQSTSTDGGRTWSPGAIYMEGRHVANKRFFIRRLQSGALLMVRNNGPTGARSHLTAFVSDDDGASWKGGFILDERDPVAYPDGVQAPDGTTY